MSQEILPHGLVQSKKTGSRWSFKDSVLLLLLLLLIAAMGAMRFAWASAQIETWLVDTIRIEALLSADHSAELDALLKTSELERLRELPKQLPMQQALSALDEAAALPMTDTQRTLALTLANQQLQKELKGDIHRQRDWLQATNLIIIGVGIALAWLSLRRESIPLRPAEPHSQAGALPTLPQHRSDASQAAVDLILEVNGLLDEVPLGESAFENVLRRLVSAFEIRSAAIHVLDEDMGAIPGLTGTLSTTGILQALFDFQPWAVRAEHIQSVLQEDIQFSHGGEERDMALMLFPLQEQGRHIGQLAFEALPGMRLTESQTKMAVALARQISSKIGAFHLAQDLRRVALFEERAAIARELHDSLAQSLAYMKIQIARLQVAIDARKPVEETAGVLSELRDGLNGAYRKLRELLTTFRVNIGVGGLQTGLEETVQEVMQRSALAVVLDYRMGSCRLSSNEEIHVLHVVREALSNVMRHADADHATITLEYDHNRYLTGTIDDDGRGSEDHADRRFHHGISIMEDRVASLGGTLVMDARPGGGTRVRFRFTPSWSGSRDLLAEQ
jgi:two-component system nitrate/nitrite sensor histidine kinase NarX